MFDWLLDLTVLRYAAAAGFLYNAGLIVWHLSGPASAFRTLPPLARGLEALVFLCCLVALPFLFGPFEVDAVMRGADLSVHHRLLSVAVLLATLEGAIAALVFPVRIGPALSRLWVTLAAARALDARSLHPDDLDSEELDELVGNWRVRGGMLTLVSLLWFVPVLASWGSSNFFVFGVFGGLVFFFDAWVRSLPTGSLSRTLRRMGRQEA